MIALLFTLKYQKKYASLFPIQIAMLIGMIEWAYKNKIIKVCPAKKGLVQVVITRDGDAIKTYWIDSINTSYIWMLHWIGCGINLKDIGSSFNNAWMHT